MSSMWLCELVVPTQMGTELPCPHVKPLAFQFVPRYYYCQVPDGEGREENRSGCLLCVYVRTRRRKMGRINRKWFCFCSNPSFCLQNPSKSHSEDVWRGIFCTLKDGQDFPGCKMSPKYDSSTTVLYCWRSLFLVAL